MSYKCPLCNPLSIILLTIGLTLIVFKNQMGILNYYLGLALILTAYIYPFIYSILTARKR